MKVSIQFQYQPDDSPRPIDGSDHNDPIETEDGQFMPVPDVGDTVNYMSYHYDYDEKGSIVEGSGREIMVARKVKTRHFGYSEGYVFVNVVVGDVPDGEMAMRLKE
jgi:hypothetical protein